MVPVYLVGFCGLARKKVWRGGEAVLQGYCRIWGCFGLVKCGEFVVFCVAGVVFEQACFGR
jgi:hypothetical protein